MNTKQQNNLKKGQQNEKMVLFKVRSPKFSAVSLQTKPIKWTRDEANER